MAELKRRIQTDLSAAMKARDQVRTRTLRMMLTAITNAEVAGAAARELSDDEVVRVLGREARKRREAADAFAAAGRLDRAEVERAEGAVITEYLPAQLDDDELTRIVDEVIGASDVTGAGAFNQVMKTVMPRVAGRADGARVAAEVRRRLAER